MSNIICSKCNYEINTISLPNFCPSCGVKFTLASGSVNENLNSPSHTLDKSESTKSTMVHLGFGIMVKRKTRLWLFISAVIFQMLVFLDKNLFNGALNNFFN
jgi:hypothetical protein